MSVLLKNAPVYYALSQAKFNPVAAMAKYSTDIQEAMRRAGYTIFETEDMQNIDFSMAPDAEEPKPVVTTNKNWFFTKSDRSCGFVLGQDFLSFQSTDYSDRGEFFQALCQGLKIVHEIVQLDSVERLGIRYLNAVMPLDGENVHEYLNPQIHGVDFGLQILGDVWEAGYRTNEGILIAKVYQAPSSPLGFPGDLQPRSVRLLEKFQRSEPFAHAVIDMDLFVEELIPFDTDVVYERLMGFHGDLAKCFHAIATPHAFDRWS